MLEPMQTGHQPHCPGVGACIPGTETREGGHGMLTSVELFAGAGGLGMGLSLAGFEHLAVIEWDRWACDTIRENQDRGHPLVASWPLIEGDVRDFDYESIGRSVDLVAGGPPCQPFSICGKHKGHHDDRDMFPATVDAIRRLRPRAFIVENVKGLSPNSECRSTVPEQAAVECGPVGSA